MAKKKKKTTRGNSPKTTNKNKYKERELRKG